MVLVQEDDFFGIAVMDDGYRIAFGSTDLFTVRAWSLGCLSLRS